MATGRQRLLRQQVDRAAQLADAFELPTADVTAVTGGAATDGNPLVTVNFLGASMQVRYLLSYTPVVGHRVVMARSAGAWLILGRPGGFPTTP